MAAKMLRGHFFFISYAHFLVKMSRKTKKCKRKRSFSSIDASNQKK